MMNSSLFSTNNFICFRCEERVAGRDRQETREGKKLKERGHVALLFEEEGHQMLFSRIPPRVPLKMELI